MRGNHTTVRNQVRIRMSGAEPCLGQTKLRAADRQGETLALVRKEVKSREKLWWAPSVGLCYA